MIACSSCGEGVPDHVALTRHWTEGPRQDGYGHKGLCCDCFDVLLGATVESINEERAGKGKGPLPIKEKL